MTRKVGPNKGRGKAPPVVPSIEDVEQARDRLLALAQRLDGFVRVLKSGRKVDWAAEGGLFVMSADELRAAQSDPAHVPAGGGPVLRMMIRTIEAATLAFAHDMQVDAEHAKKAGIIDRVIKILDVARWSADDEELPGVPVLVDPDRLNDAKGFERHVVAETMNPGRRRADALYMAGVQAMFRRGPKQAMADAVEYALQRASGDPDGLGKITADQWGKAIVAWEGMEVSRAGNPKRGAKPYSWQVVAFGLLQPHGLTDARTPAALKGLYIKVYPNNRNPPK